MVIFKYKILLLLIALTVIFFHRSVFNFDQIIYPAPDIFYSSYIEKTLISHSIVNYKLLPFWNPYIFGGSPFLGNPTSTMFYPLNLLFVLLPANSVFGYMFAINSLLIGVFTYLYARIIKIGEFGSSISAISVMFSGPMVTSVYAGHPILSDTFIWFPLAILFFELMITKKKLIFAIIAGLTITLMFFSGAPQIAVYEILSLLLYFSLRSISGARNVCDFFKLSTLPIVAIAIGVLSASVQLLPSFEFSRFTQRASNGISYAFASDFSLHPFQILSFVFPFFFGSPINGTFWGKGNFWELNGYIGILPLIFAIIATIFKKNRYVLIFFILGVFAILHAIGKYGFVFPFFYYHIPGFDNFRVPARFLFIYAFSFSILAGIGASFLVNNFLNKIKYIVFKFSILISAIFFFLIGTLLLLEPNNATVSIYEKYVLRNSFAVGINHSVLYSQTRDDILILLTLFLSLFIAIIIVKKNKIRMHQLKIFIILLTFLNLWWFGSRFIDTINIKEIFNSTSIINTILKDKDTYRVFDMKGEFTPHLAKNSLESITGVNPLYLKDTRDFLWSVGKHVNLPFDSFIGIDEISNPVFINLLNVKYIISNSKIKVNELSEIMESKSDQNHFSSPNQTHYLYKNTSMLPRAYIVPNALVINDRQKTLNFIANKSFDPNKYVILENSAKNIALKNSSSFKEIRITKNNFNKMSLNFSLANSGFLVLSEIYYPGWKAYDNNKETEIFKANYIFRSIYLNPGEHKIIFIYNPISYNAGFIVSSATILICLTYILKKRKHLKIKVVHF